MKYPLKEPRCPQRKAGNQPSEPWHCLDLMPNHLLTTQRCKNQHIQHRTHTFSTLVFRFHLDFNVIPQTATQNILLCTERKHTSEAAM